MQRRKDIFESAKSDLSLLSKIGALLFLIIFLCGCNSQEKTLVHKQVFLMGETDDFRMVIADVIEQSEIRKGGYVVIIPSSTRNNNAEVTKLKKVFYNLEIMAVHILNINPKSILKKTEILTIENANIICLVGEDGKYLKKKSLLKTPLVNALNNNTCFVVSNKESEQQLLLMKKTP